MQILNFIDPASHEAIRSISLEGQPWFAATDICRILAHTNPAQAVKGLDPSECMAVKTAALTVTSDYSQSGGARGITRFPGITEDARTLNVNRTTLFRALTGQWKLPGLMGRYNALKRK